MFKDAPPFLFPMQKADARSGRLLATRFSFCMLLSIFSIAYMDLRRKSKTVPMLCQCCGTFFIVCDYSKLQVIFNFHNVLHFRSDFCSYTHFSLLNSMPSPTRLSVPSASSILLTGNGCQYGRSNKVFVFDRRTSKRRPDMVVYFLIYFIEMLLGLSLNFSVRPLIFPSRRSIISIEK